MIKKLRLKFIAINMFIVAVMLSVIFGLVYSSTRQNLENRASAMLQAVVSDPFHMEPQGITGGEFGLPYFILQTTRDGSMISASGGYYDLSDEEYLLELLEAVRSQRGDEGILSDYNLRYYRQINPRGITVAFCDMVNETQLLEGLVRNLIITGILSVLGFLGFSVLLSRWAVRPVEKAWKEQRQFVADASHELKTPLTVIMTNAELLQSPEFSEEERARFSESILTMTRQMRGLLEKMLELARADNGVKTENFADLDLSRLAEEAELSFEGVFFEKDLMLTSDIAPDIHVRADSQGIRQVIDILLDNAQKYSAPGGETKCSLTAARGKCRLSVASPGTPIPDENLEKIFTRFWRQDSARSRDGSFGLGLAIARQIVTRHRGKIWAETGEGYNTFIMELNTLQSR